MGDRANVVVAQDGGKVWLYTHWGGYELPGVLKAALERGSSRHDDGPYLARIILCEMVKDDPMGLTGAGIAPCLCDNGHPLLVVDTLKGTVHEAAEDDPDTPTAGPWAMAEYPGEWAGEDDVA